MWPPPPIKPKLLIAIAILPLLLFYTKQTWAQEPADGMPSAPTAATGKTYGLGGYKMDDKQQVMVPEYALLLKTTEEVVNYKAMNADKQFKPCMMELNKDNKFQLVYDEDTAKDGCTVDLVIGPSEDEKTFNAEMVLADPISCLDDCGVKTYENELAAGSANLFPFTYSLSNEQFKMLHNGPPYKEDQKCRPVCEKYGGKCMNSATSLQLAWNKCTTKVKAWIQLVGEPWDAWTIEQEAKGKEAAIDLIIATGSNPTVTMQISIEGDNIFAKTVFPIGNNGKPRSATCFTDDKVAMIPELKFWTIKSDNAQLNGKQLLVFHFLPQAATRIFDKEGRLQNAPGPGMPKCKGKLAIAFKNIVGLLQSVPEPITTQTTEKTTSLGTTGATPEGTVSTTQGRTASTKLRGTTNTISQVTELTSSEGSTNTSNATTAAVNWEAESTAGARDDKALLIAIGAGGPVLLLVIVIVLVWCLCCRNKKKKRKQKKDAEIGEESQSENENKTNENAVNEDKPKSTRVQSTRKDDGQDADENAQEGNNPDYEVLEEPGDLEEQGGGNQKEVIVPETVQQNDEDLLEGGSREGVIVPETVQSNENFLGGGSRKGVIVPDTIEDGEEEQKPDEDAKEEDSKNHDEGVVVPDTVGSEREDNSKNRDEDAKEENAAHLSSRYIE